MAPRKHSPKQTLLAGIAVAAVAAGITVAVMTATGKDHKGRVPSASNSADRAAERGGRRGDLTVAADYLGLPEEQLRSELRSGQVLAHVADAAKGKSSAGLIAAIVAARKANLADAVAAGVLTPAEQHAALASLSRRVTLRVNRAAALSATGGATAVAGLRAAAAYLGIPRDQLRKDLLSGRTLARVANATKGKTVAGLIAAVVADRKAKLAAAVTAGKLTRKRAKKQLAGLEQRVAAQVSGGKRREPAAKRK